MWQNGKLFLISNCNKIICLYFFFQAFPWLLRQFIVLTIIYYVDCKEDMKLLTRLPKNPMIKYTSYSSVMILHFNIPFDVEKAVFIFKAKDSPTSMLGKILCFYTFDLVLKFDFN